ncbi:MAG: preprotein translocase subunit SecG [Candidatus Aenigmarchaeota archaeon]|nr:preprotein translocase subunit SecG [Candidatus Aenigmarchaeota archaeon]
MSLVVNILQIVISILLVICILLQNKGSGLGSAFGGQTSYQTKRGAQKFLHIATIVLAILFIGIGIANLLLSK